MIKRVKIIGAGSIGNHLSNACRVLGWKVDLCDSDSKALERTKKLIYPSRYGKWDKEISLFNMKNVPRGCYDVIFIGTPPDTHVDLALRSIEEKPKAICIEKPVCGPDLKKLSNLLDMLRKNKILAFVGYDHVVGDAAQFASKIAKKLKLQDIQYIEMEIKEHWEGIFGAHPWLDGPKDSYLGFYKRGGGACSEHSHGINLLQHFASLVGAGKISRVSALHSYVKTKSLNYDKISSLNVKTEKGLNCRIFQDVVTRPTSKRLKIVSNEGFIEWVCNFKKNIDMVSWKNKNLLHKKEFKKTRADDFINEIKHLRNVIIKKGTSPISLARGADTMMVISAAHKSSLLNKHVTINYNKGYKLTSIS